MWYYYFFVCGVWWWIGRMCGEKFFVFELFFWREMWWCLFRGSGRRGWWSCWGFVVGVGELFVFWGWILCVVVWWVGFCLLGVFFCFGLVLVVWVFEVVGEVIVGRRGWSCGRGFWVLVGRFWDFVKVVILWWFWFFGILIVVCCIFVLFCLFFVGVVCGSWIIVFWIWVMWEGG